MKTSKTLKTLAVIMAVLLSCCIFTGKKMVAIVTPNIAKILQNEGEDENRNNEKALPKLNRRERKEAKQIAERLKMLKK